VPKKPFSLGWAEAFSTDRKQFADLFTNMLNGFMFCKIITDKDRQPVDWIYLDINGSFERIIGFQKEKVIGKRATDLYPDKPIDLLELIIKYGHIALSEQPAQFEFYQASLKKWLNISAYSPKKGYFITIFEDITERKKAEKSLIESERLYRTIFDNSEDGFQLVKPLCDENGQVVDCLFLKVNSAYEQQSGLKAQDIVGKTAKQIMPNTEQYWFDLYAEVSKRGVIKHVENYNESTKRWYDFFVFPYSEGQVGVLLRDINERKSLERQLKDAERLAAIGATAGMVGHDIRNPLQAITGDVYLAKSDLTLVPNCESKTSIQESLTAIEKNVDYINKIVQDLQDFAKPLNPCLRKTDIKLIIDKLLEKNPLPENVKVSINVEAEAREILVDSDYATRILYNLLINAVQAMPNGGNLTIRAYKENDDKIVSIKDTGVGIAEDAKDKLFTPMFTTKSKGQGFGLAVIKRMTEALGGTVCFESQEGKGTTFIVRFPPKDKQ
jgi:PAS domain S-box-containing protein